MSVPQSAPDTGLPPYDLGILLISANQPGPPSSALRELNDTLVEWFQNRGRFSPEPRPTIQCATFDVVLEQQGEAPPHAELGLTDSVEEPRAHRWLLAGSHFDEQIARQDAKAFLRWLLWVLPFFVIDYFVGQARKSRQLPGPAPVRWLRALPGQAGLAIAGLLGIGVAGLLLSLLLAQTLRVPLAAKLSITFGSSLERLVGASYLQVASPTGFEAMVTKAEADLAWLRARSRRVAIVAPSFGVSVAHRVVQRNTASVDLFVTMGSTLRKVLVARQLDLARRYEPGLEVVLPMLDWLMASIVKIGGLAWFLSTLAIGPLLVSDGEWALALIVVLSGVALSALATSPRLDESEDIIVKNLLAEAEIPLPAFHGTWLSFVSSADAFAGEQIMEASLAGGPRRIDVVNQASILSDHREYLRNIEEVQTRLVHALLRVAQPPFDITYPKERLERAVWRRRLRMPWLVRSRWAAATNGLLTALAVTPAIAEWLDIYTTRERLALLDLPAGLPELGEALLSRASLVFAIVWVITALLLYRVFRTAWAGWDKVDRWWALDDLRRHRDETIASFVLVLLGPTIIFVGLLALILGLLGIPFSLLARYEFFAVSPVRPIIDNRLVQLVVVMVGLLIILFPLLNFILWSLSESQRWLRFRIRHISAPMLQLVMERTAELLAHKPEVRLNGVNYRLVPVRWLVARRRRPAEEAPAEVPVPPDVAMTLARGQVVLIDVRHEYPIKAVRFQVAWVQGNTIFGVDAPTAPVRHEAAALRLAHKRDWTQVRHELVELAPYVGLSEALSPHAVLRENTIIREGS